MEWVWLTDTPAPPSDGVGVADTDTPAPPSDGVGVAHRHTSTTL